MQNMSDGWSIPDELISMILQSETVTNQQDGAFLPTLAACTRVSRRFHCISLPLLYRNPQAIGYDFVNKIVDTLSSNDYLAELVEQLSLHLYHLRPAGWCREDGNRQMASLTNFPHLPNCKQLTITSFRLDEESILDNEGLMVPFKAVMKWAARCPRLQRLRLCDCSDEYHMVAAPGSHRGRLVFSEDDKFDDELSETPIPVPPPPFPPLLFELQISRHNFRSYLPSTETIWYLASPWLKTLTIGPPMFELDDYVGDGYQESQFRVIAEGAGKNIAALNLHLCQLSSAVWHQLAGWFPNLEALSCTLPTHLTRASEGKFVKLHTLSAIVVDTDLHNMDFEDELK